MDMCLAYWHFFLVFFLYSQGKYSGIPSKNGNGAFYLLHFIMYIIRLVFWDMEGPNYLMALETIVWIYAILGISFSYLNFGNKYLSYLSEAAYPVYIIHWIFIQLGSILLFRFDISRESSIYWIDNIHLFGFNYSLPLSDKKFEHFKTAVWFKAEKQSADSN